MAELPSKHCCVGNMDSFSDDCEKQSIGPDGVFPSEDDDGECCFFPLEDSLNPGLNQIVVTDAVSNDDHSNYSVSDNVAVVNIDADLGKELTKIGNILISICVRSY